MWLWWVRVAVHWYVRLRVRVSVSASVKSLLYTPVPGCGRSKHAIGWRAMRQAGVVLCKNASWRAAVQRSGGIAGKKP